MAEGVELQVHLAVHQDTGVGLESVHPSEGL